MLHHISPRSWRLRIATVVVLALILAPLFPANGFLLGFLCQVAIVSIISMSYNMLLGQTGMLSFGHAIYSGFGAYLAIHVLNKIGADSLGLAEAFIPLVGGIGGALAGAAFGYVSTRQTGTPFAMITLGIVELVVALSSMVPSWSGGEAGITTNRMLGTAVAGIDFGSATQIYYLLLAWAVLAVLAMYAYTRTPFGRLANAVRDNGERVAFVGFDPQWIRYNVMILSGFFAGIGGGMSILNYELVTSENLGLGQSGMALIAAYLGGTGTFWGPIAGALLYVIFQSFVSTITNAWLLYLGLLFIITILFSPQGIAGFMGGLGASGPYRLRRVALGLFVCAAIVALVEYVQSAQEGAISMVDMKDSTAGLLAHGIWWMVAAIVLIMLALLTRRILSRPDALSRKVGGQTS